MEVVHGCWVRWRCKCWFYITVYSPHFHCHYYSQMDIIFEIHIKKNWLENTSTSIHSNWECWTDVMWDDDELRWFCWVLFSLAGAAITHFSPEVCLLVLARFCATLLGMLDSRLFIGLSLFVVIASMELWQCSSLVLPSAEQHKNKIQQVSCSLEKHQDVKPTPQHWTKNLFRIYPVESQGSPGSSTQALTINSRFVLSVFCFSYMYGFAFLLKENLRLMCVFIQATRFYFTLFIVL